MTEAGRVPGEENVHTSEHQLEAYAWDGVHPMELLRMSIEGGADGDGGQ